MTITEILSALQARRRTSNQALAAFRHLGALGLLFLAILDGTPLPTFGGPDIEQLSVHGLLSDSHREQGVPIWKASLVGNKSPNY